jgi:hypothetical protein
MVSVNTTLPGTNGAQSTLKTIAYDAKGNITSRSDVGAYTYGASNASCAAIGGVATAGAHAVSMIASMGVTGGKNANYCYDANGNLLSGDGRTVTWTAYDMVSSVQRGTSLVSFEYGPDRARFRRTDVTAQGTTSTLYVGGKAMEVITRPGGKVETKTYIGDFAVVTTANAVTTTSYMHTFDGTLLRRAKSAPDRNVRGPPRLG